MVHVHLTPSLTLYADRFRLGHVPGSLNLPKQHAFQPDGSLTPSASSSNLSSVRSSRVVIVVANKGESGPVVGSVHIQSGVVYMLNMEVTVFSLSNCTTDNMQFARQLVRLNFPHVCVLHNGAGVLRSLGLFTSLGDDP